MAKSNSVFFCKECGHESAKWMGQCPGCGQWNTLVEEKVTSTKKSAVSVRREASSQVTSLSKVAITTHDRTTTGIGELDRVLGGGIVKGCLCLVGGDPGIGKSTLLLQMCKNLVEKDLEVLYVSGEESVMQIKMRADRLGEFKGDLMLLSETSLEVVLAAISSSKPKIVIIDSIQTMVSDNVDSAPGSVSQVRETTAALMKIAKGEGISVFIVGHVTKEGVVAGPKVLEHMVDTVLYFEGDNQAAYRILRANKNRFGSTNEIGVFRMEAVGLTEVTNPSEYMLTGRPEDEAGSVVTCTIEGTRTILIEIQALVCQTSFSLPRRTAAGTDYNRVNLLLAVLEKRMGVQMSGCDAYVNVAGGMKVNEPSLDLAIVAALLSSFKNRSIDSKTIVFGEVGLAGEVRAVGGAQQRINEAVKLGFTEFVVPRACMNGISVPKNAKVYLVDNIRQLSEII